MKIPEGGDENPDILDEARVELEWFFKMMVKSDDPYYGKDAGNSRLRPPESSLFRRLST